jgi:hypothetical protein
MLSDFLYHASKDTAGEYGGEALNDDLAKVREKFGDLWAVLQERLTGPAMLSNIAGMNSVGWAAMLLLCEKQGVPVHSTRDAVAIWRSGLSLRREIGGVIRTEFTSADSLRDSLVQLVTRQLEQQGITAQEWPGFAHALLARGILRTQPDVPRIPRSSPAAPYAAHVGTLEVEKIAPKNDPSRAPKSLMRVRSADAGYSKLFLLPFAERTGLRADSLSRMLRHFGGSDDDLVGNIAKVVVNKCYLVQKDALEPVSFEARTKDIVASLTATDGAAEQDILELHGQYNGETVYVRRNVTLFEEEGVDQDSPKRVFYRWTFSDMTAEWSLADYPKYVRPVPTQKAS